MHSTFALSLTVLAVVLSAFAAPTPARPMPMNARRYAKLAAIESSSLTKRGCNPMPSSVDPTMRDFIYKHVRSKTKDPKILLITMVTAYRESMVNNLDCGDQDSVGLYQQRPSQGWGSREQCMDPTHATDAFLNALNGCYQGHEDEDAGQLAQCVQGAQAGNRYTENEATAKKLIEEAAASVGDSGNDSGDSSSSSSSSTKTHTSHSSTATESTTSGAINVGGNPSATETSTSAEPTSTDDCSDDGSGNDSGDSSSSDGSCTKTYTPVSGDNCYKVSDMFGISLDDLYSLNPSIDQYCSNLNAGTPYCVSTA